MKCDKKHMLLYAVTDRAWVGKQSLLEQVESALKGGVTCVQIREKNLNDEDFLKEAIEMKRLCEKYAVPLIVNDNVEVAIKCSADGVHVGQKDMQAQNVRKLVGDNMIIGVSAQNVEQALKAQETGADYLGVGAMFSTSTKLDAKEVSFETLKKICDTVEIPVVAIGGIKESNILQLKGLGADGVAVVSDIFSSQDIEGKCKALHALAQEIINK